MLKQAIYETTGQWAEYLFNWIKQQKKGVKKWRRIYSRFVYCCFFLSLFISFQAEAGDWSDWYEMNVPAHSSYTTYFIPGVEGTHEIEWANEWSTYYTGNMDSYWGSSNNMGVWYWFANNNVLSTIQDKELYSGSSDIIYKFVYHNVTDYTHQFFYRFYTDD